MAARSADGADSSSARRAVVLVNGAEGEPLSAKDRTLMALRPHLVLDGAVLAADAVGADEIVVYVDGSPTDWKQQISLPSNGGNQTWQLLGAVNLAAGAQHNATADAAIADAESLLLNNSLNLLTSVVSPSTALGGELTDDASTLDDFNGADFNTCSEGSGLNF